MEKLRKLYNIVKDHPYRIGWEQQFYSSYVATLVELRDEFCNSIEKNIHRKYWMDKKYNLIVDYHSFNSNLRKLDPKWINKDIILYFENYISMIHAFMENKGLDFLYFYSSKFGTIKADWSNEHQRFLPAGQRGYKWVEDKIRHYSKKDLQGNKVAIGAIKDDFIKVKDILDNR